MSNSELTKKKQNMEETNESNKELVLIIEEDQELINKIIY